MLNYSKSLFPNPSRTMDHSVWNTVYETASPAPSVYKETSYKSKCFPNVHYLVTDQILEGRC